MADQVHIATTYSEEFHQTDNKQNKQTYIIWL